MPIIADDLSWEDVELLHQNGVFCPLAWVGLSDQGECWRLCQHALRLPESVGQPPLDQMNGEARRLIRRAMLEARRELLGVCAACHRMEDRGEDSPRVTVMRRWRGDSVSREKILEVIRSTDNDFRITPWFFDTVLVSQPVRELPSVESELQIIKGRTRMLKSPGNLSWDDIRNLSGNGVFCPEAWVGISNHSTGRHRLCCYAAPSGHSLNDTTPLEYLNTEEVKRTRLAMLAGDRSGASACERCHYNEDRGIQSRRQRLMEGWETSDQIMTRILEVVNTTREDGGINPIYIDRMDIKFIGNKCNLRCLPCDAHNSSSIAIEQKKIGELPPDHKTIFDPLNELPMEMNERFWDHFDQILPIVRVLNFTGGEPFMIDAYWRMLDRAIELGHAQDMELHMTSNLTMIKYGKRNVMDYFGKFKKVQIWASLDSTYDFNNYMRYPSDFFTVIRNAQLLQFIHPNVQIEITSVINAFSVKMLPELHRQLKEWGIEHNFNNILYYPIYQRVENLPERIKRSYLEQFYADPKIRETFASVISLLETPDPGEDYLEKLVALCRSRDKHRGTDFTKLWPEFQT